MAANGLSTYYDDQLNGTSFAAPHCAGIAALLLAADPQLRADDVQGIIRASADDIGSAGYDDETGFGRVSASPAKLPSGKPARGHLERA
jgi:subtilisin family serine protease